MTEMEVGSIAIELNRKAIKHLHISVLPPDGRVRVSAPKSMTDNAIRTAVINRIPWIKKQKNFFESQPRQTLRQLVTGECHYLWGKKYRLDVITGAGKSGIEVRQNKIRMYLARSSSYEARDKVLEKHYREILKERVSELLEIWSKRIDVSVSAWTVRKMKTKWGSCNTEQSRISVNLELVKKPPECLEFIIVHELIHLLERHHNDRFRALMDSNLPDWKERRSLLNSMPLAHGSWDY